MASSSRVAKTLRRCKFIWESKALVYEEIVPGLPEMLAEKLVQGTYIKKKHGPIGTPRPITSSQRRKQKRQKLKTA